MKKRKILLFGALLMLMILTVSMSAMAKSKKSKAQISDKRITIRVGEEYEISLINAKSVKWKSGKKKIASVKRSGPNKAVIFGKKPGSAVITARYKGKKYKCKVVVEGVKKLGNITDYINSDGTFKAGIKMDVMEPTSKTGKTLALVTPNGSKAKKTQSSMHYYAFWAAIVDDCLETLVGTLGDLVYYNGQWCIPVRQEKGRIAPVSIGNCNIMFVTRVISEDRVLKGIVEKKVVSVSDPRIEVLDHHPYSTEKSDTLMYFAKKNKDEMIPNGTFFTVNVTYGGIPVTIPCVIDEYFDRTKYKTI